MLFVIYLISGSFFKPNIAQLQGRVLPQVVRREVDGDIFAVEITASCFR